MLAQQVIAISQLGVASWSKTSLTIGYELTGSVLSKPSPALAPSLTAEESDRVLVSGCSMITAAVISVISETDISDQLPHG